MELYKEFVAKTGRSPTNRFHHLVEIYGNVATKVLVTSPDKHRVTYMGM